MHINGVASLVIVRQMAVAYLPKCFGRVSEDGRLKNLIREQREPCLASKAWKVTWYSKSTRRPDSRSASQMVALMYPARALVRV